ncbi:MAG TPA: hypothetical protein DCQ06_09335 [Myxococcales bacterium]|nr:hypothetical protein [Myxococcales bacterium]
MRMWTLGLLIALMTTCGGETDGASSTSDVTSAADTQPAAKDQCQGADDMAWLKSDQASGQSGRDLAREAAGDCGLGCLNHPAPDQCAIKCMLQDKGVVLSNGCAGCYGGIVLCSIANCLPKCIDDAQAQVCKDCQEDKGCNDIFYDCTGPLD